MKHLCWATFCALALLIAGCGSQPAAPAATSVPAPAATVIPAGGIDFSDPTSVTQAVFTAAASNDFTPLAGLCDPRKENDSDTQSICDLVIETSFQSDFLTAFAQGKVSGPATLRSESGLEYADVLILMGPDGSEAEILPSSTAMANGTCTVYRPNPDLKGESNPIDHENSRPASPGGQTDDRKSFGRTGCCQASGWRRHADRCAGAQ